MMIRTFVATAGAFTLLLSGTAAASAYPIQGAPELTHNPLYKQGRLPSISCKAAKGTSRASTTKYIKKIIGCLNSAWSKTVEDFAPAEADVESTIELKSCLSGMEISGSIAVPCYGSIVVQLRSDWIKAKSDTAILVELTRAYGRLIQAETGISKAWWALPSSGVEAEMNEQTYRFYLQTDCLVGVSMKALGRSAGNWEPLLGAETPREYDRFNWYGKRANRLYWFKQGYTSGGPGACNTWKASSAKVS
ncbi:hypothetical protein HS041_14845 [Planomonospora sp. ID67723]|uniref:hypothetical protein n=1 Tax=Planomonospora sp. ID67723 TaxID=2738134 RepID=UPI0018C40DAD|nr:hypothetical protein [Planomonospora sp. ID67723]MBG0829047.1 hypothetical protein [Planomonospora sp. ID67723]